MPCPRAAGCNLCYAREDCLSALSCVGVNPAQPPPCRDALPAPARSLACVPDRPSKTAFQDPARAGGDPVLLPPLVWRVRFIKLFITGVPAGRTVTAAKTPSLWSSTWSTYRSVILYPPTLLRGDPPRRSVVCPRGGPDPPSDRSLSRRREV